MNNFRDNQFQKKSLIISRKLHDKLSLIKMTCSYDNYNDVVQAILNSSSFVAVCPHCKFENLFSNVVCSNCQKIIMTKENRDRLKSNHIGHTQA